MNGARRKNIMARVLGGLFCSNFSGWHRRPPTVSSCSNALDGISADHPGGNRVARE
jgi:hypothetical protein